MNTTTEAEIRRIMLDRSIPPEQKQHMISRIRTSSTSSTGTRRESTDSQSHPEEILVTTPTSPPRFESFPSPPAHNMSLTCEHYDQKRCSQLYFDCCGVYDPCHWCHLARGCRVRPAQTSSLACNQCHTRQPISNQCVSCGIRFGRIHCAICKLWTEIDVFHCHDCGMCRVGHLSDTYHCPDCDCCWSREHRNDHNCVGKSWKELSCPFCLESMHFSRVAGRVLRCHHVVHITCAETALRNQLYRCPICRKAMCDMDRYYRSLRFSIASQPISPEILMPIRVGDTVETENGEDFVVTEIGQDGTTRGYFPFLASQSESKTVGEDHTEERKEAAEEKPNQPMPSPPQQQQQQQQHRDRSRSGSSESAAVLAVAIHSNNDRTDGDGVHNPLYHERNTGVTSAAAISPRSPRSPPSPSRNYTATHRVVQQQQQQQQQHQQQHQQQQLSSSSSPPSPSSSSSPLSSEHFHHERDDPNRRTTGTLFSTEEGRDETRIAEAKDTTTVSARVLHVLPSTSLRKKMTVRVYCYECEQVSVAPFHFLGLECQYCRGYNTCRS